jgi:transcriptional regulator with XRE-family HTH domain
LRILRQLTDEAVLAEVGRRIARTRLERNLSQQHLAADAGVGQNTLKRLEAGRGATLVNTIRVLRALDLIEGLELAVPEPAPSPIELLKLEGRRRRRASRRVSSSGDAEAPRPKPWRWGDETPDPSPEGG